MPPSGMALNLELRDEILVLLAGKRLKISLRLAFSELKKEFVFVAFPG